MNPFEWLVDGAENGSVVRTRVLQALQILLDWAVSATVALFVLGVGFVGADLAGVTPSAGVVSALWVLLTWLLFALFRGVGLSVLYWLGGRRAPPRRISERSPETGS